MQGLQLKALQWCIDNNYWFIEFKEASIYYKESIPSNNIKSKLLKELDTYKDFDYVSFLC